VSILKMDPNKANVQNVSSILGLRTAIPFVDKILVMQMGQKRLIQMGHVKNALFIQELKRIQVSLMLIPKSCVLAIIVE
jgi:hypothetical protein